MKKSKANDFDDYAKREKPNRRKKRSSKAADLSDAFYVDADKWQQVEQNIEQGFYARVVEVHKRYSFISPESELGKIATRDVWLATVARKFLQAERSERNFVCVGDRVFCCPADENSPVVSEELPHCSIELALKRKNSISRVDPRLADRRHVLASNIDQLVIVASYLNPTVKWGLIDRYIVLAESEGIVPSIILNKKDLLDEVEKERFKEECLNYADYYEKIGYRVLRLQAENKDTIGAKSLNQLEEMFSDRISLISGHSGVGKSSIVNLLGPEITQDVETDGIFYKGRHTTTYASLIKLKKGGIL
ncbi:MAG: ribosome small subunit-dependent GTPase A [Bdellovibrionota bacterium]